MKLNRGERNLSLFHLWGLTMLKLDTMWAHRKEVANTRLEICKQCDRIELEKMRCKECGCFMVFKSLIPFSECPLGKWTAYAEEEKKDG